MHVSSIPLRPLRFKWGWEAINVSGEKVSDEKLLMRNNHCQAAALSLPGKQVVGAASFASIVRCGALSATRRR